MHKLLLILGLSLAVLSCGQQPQSHDINPKGPRFQVTYSQMGGHDIFVIRDIQTDKEYLFYKVGYAGGMVELTK